VKIEELGQERLERVLRAVALEEPDRTPVVLEYAGFAARVTSTPMARFVSSPAAATRTMIKAYGLVGGGDAINYGSFSPYGLCSIFMAKVRVPGYDLPEDEMWQVEERELMTPGDYDRLLEMGWPGFSAEFLKQRILDDAAPELLPANLERVEVQAEWSAAGVPVLSGGDVAPPLELLCGARSLAGFANDLYRIPDKVEAAMEAITPHLAGKAIAGARTKGFPALWIGGWRAAPSMLSPAMWDRFVWPFFKRLVEEVTRAGLIALLHLDSNWTRELARFKELPTGRCILATDGETDLREARRLLKGRMCLMGDVPASLLYLGEPEEVRAYCRSLIRDLGPEGFILQSGCDIPANARLENVRAMVASVEE